MASVIHSDRTSTGQAPRKTSHSPSWKKRALKLIRTEIDFVPNTSFRERDRGLEQAVLKGHRSTDVSRRNRMPSDLPPHLGRLCEMDLLSAEQERACFYRMNYLKYRANALRAQLDPEQPDRSKIRQAEAFLAAARQTRDHIIRSNMRLVMSIVKKLVTSRHSFDEMLSEGIFSLMQAVDKFDYDRGFRFSTYAYRAIARNSCRVITNQQKRQSRFFADGNEGVSEVADTGETASLDERTWMRLRDHLSKMLRRLDRRERLIIRSRYALGRHDSVETFQAIADTLGISKERVRQLEKRAVDKLRDMAAKVDEDMLDFGVPSRQGA